MIENQTIDNLLYKGYYGIAELLDLFKKEDVSDFNLLLKNAGVKFKKENNYFEFQEFIFDSLRLNPDCFMDKWKVNFWIARDINLAALSQTYHLESVDKEEMVFKILHAINEV